ncbi:hypothetical protein Taro_004034 [Colocasia esculenta]|uniref:Uncharacterized protein n=1 Tax=Colocasia esculenta TaxID=4460 RepID=A0A843TQJ7_COLES|nr:hypothetical protein [Colocasia esculenta]
MASPNALLVLGLFLPALLYGSSAGEALAGEQATVKKARRPQHSTVAVGGNAVKYYANNNKGATAAAEVTTTTTEGEGYKDDIDTDQRRFCNCCSYFRRCCARLCCADGRQIPLI